MKVQMLNLHRIDYESKIYRSPKNLTNDDLQMVLYNVRILNDRVNNEHFSI